MLKCFGDLIGRTVEAYVDDIIVKSKWVDHLVADLKQTFAKLQEVCFRGPKGHAARLHHFRAWHRSQPGEDFSHHKDGPDSKHE